MNREDILITINEIIKEDFPCNWVYKEVSEDSLLTDSGMDSFSYAMFWLGISEKYSIIKKSDNLSEEDKNKKGIEYVNGIDYKVYKIKDLIDRIEKCM